MTVQDGIRERCKCGHDKVSHHEGRYNCLGMFCNDCKAYRNEWEKDEPPPTPRAPKSEPPPSTDPLGGQGAWTFPPAPPFPKGWP